MPTKLIRGLSKVVEGREARQTKDSIVVDNMDGSSSSSSDESLESTLVFDGYKTPLESTTELKTQGMACKFLG